MEVRLSTCHMLGAGRPQNCLCGPTAPGLQWRLMSGVWPDLVGPYLC